ncbi:MAG: hypothetical protein KGI27_02280, partial [Thaumarchaeota archaeon]|nr:hypothetical protein [Nitrososphaerota archaeon]
MVKFSLEQRLVIIAIVGVIIESIFSYIAIQNYLPQLNKIGPLQALFVEIGIAVFIAIVVYVYSVKSEKIRKARLRRQIVYSFQMLITDFTWLATQGTANSIDEGFITKKNLRVFHIQNLFAELPERLGKDLSLQIPEVCEKALQTPLIIRPLDQKESLIVDYFNCQGLIVEIDGILQVLSNKWPIKK